MGDVTQLIARARTGDRVALDALFELLYPELRRIAHTRLSSNARSHQIETVALVNECYLKFVHMARLNPVDRNHFLAYSATVMRSIIVDTVRASQAERRGGDALHVTLSTSVGEQVALPEDEILDVHAALQALAALDERLARVAEMRYFCGMSDVEIGVVLGVTDRTVRRDWEKARLLLADVLRS
jgi:RNA polymerase sigma factor (TIGR02999 family)